LAATLAKRDEARKISLSLKESYGTLSKRVEDMEEDSPKRTELEFEQALLGVELAKKVQHEIQLEKNVLGEERAVGLVSDKEAEDRYRNMNKRSISAGDDLWRNSKKRNRFDNPGAVQPANAARRLGNF